MNKSPVFSALEYKDGMLSFIDQTKLPLKEEYIKTDNYERIAEAIEKLEIRGAPAIGVAAAYALALAFKEMPKNSAHHFNVVYERLASTRPTAVNLFWALDAMRSCFNSISQAQDYFQLLLNKALEIHDDDKKKCELIALNGLQVFEGPCNVLTHCNAGSLATGGEGTALNVIKKAFENGLVKFVHADETRPLLQGSRLTAFELMKYGIPFSVNTDSAAAYLMQNYMVDMVITGADRIAANGDSANKIGTYSLAVLCQYHDIPFYIAAPTSTIDKNLNTGEQISIEMRSKAEMTSIGNEKITSEDFDFFTPAFDVTPAQLITGIITETGVYQYPYSFK